MCADVWQWHFKHNFTYDVYLYILLFILHVPIPFFLPLIFNFSYHPTFSPFLLTAVLSLSLSLSNEQKKVGRVEEARSSAFAFGLGVSITITVCSPLPPPQPSRAVGGGSSRTSRTSRTSSAVVETKYAWQLLRASTDPRNYEMILKVSALLHFK